MYGDDDEDKARQDDDSSESACSSKLKDAANHSSIFDTAKEFREVDIPEEIIFFSVQQA